MKKIIFLAFMISISIINLYAQNSKLTLIYIEMEHCPWCHKMDREVFDNNEIVKNLQQMYNIIKLKKGSKELPEFLHPRFYPTTYILSEDNKKLIDELPGYMKVTDFTEYLHDLYEIETKAP